MVAVTDRDVVLRVLEKFTGVTAREICVLSGLREDSGNLLTELARSGVIVRWQTKQKGRSDVWRYALPGHEPRPRRRTRHHWQRMPYAPSAERLEEGRAVWRAR
jgi:hypothetical protein